MLLDDALADRILRLQIDVLAATRQGYAQVRPDVKGARVGTGYALFAGHGSPLTQVYGFGHRQAGDPAEIEAFYAGVTDNWEVTVTPFTSPETLKALSAAGYQPSHFEGTLVQTVGDVQDTREFQIEEVGPNHPGWMEATGRGWSESETGTFEPDELIRAVASMPARRYLATVDRVPAATASLYEYEDGVLMGGASTRVPFRGRGLQQALLARRLRDAGRGRLAVIGAVPGSTSHRNAQRLGFAPLYSNMVWMRR